MLSISPSKMARLHGLRFSAVLLFVTGMTLMIVGKWVWIPCMHLYIIMAVWCCKAMCVYNTCTMCLLSRCL